MLTKVITDHQIIVTRSGLTNSKIKDRKDPLSGTEELHTNHGTKYSLPASSRYNTRSLMPIFSHSARMSLNISDDK